MTFSTKYYSREPLQYYKVLLQDYAVLPVLQSTTLYYKVPLHVLTLLQSTTPHNLYYQVLLQYYSVLQSTIPVLLCTTKYYSGTTLCTTCSTKYYSVLQSTTPVLLCTTKYYSSTTPYYLYYKVLLCTSLYKVPLRSLYYSSTTLYYKVPFHSVLQSTTPVLPV